MKIVHAASRHRGYPMMVLAFCGALAIAIVVLLLNVVAAGRAEAKVSEKCVGKEQTVVKSGHIASNRPDWVYVPFDVPEGVSQLSVSYQYNRDGINALDIGIFDPDGYDLGDAAGFRGWSGGARTAFTISASEATPGYLPGPIEPGTWNLILGPYRAGPQGIDWTATITMSCGKPGPAFEPQPAPTGPLDGGAGWYRGDLHLHTVHSDGTYTQEQLVSGARAAGLDFMVSSDHNTPTANLSWGQYAQPELLVINGEEVTTRAGHWNATGLRPGQWIDWRYRPEDGQLASFVQQVHDVGGLATINHPFTACGGCDWQFGYDGGMDAIEVWNGPWTPDDDLAVQSWDKLLREGRVLTAVGASDAHRPTNQIGLPQTAVDADQLGRDAVIAGVEAGRAYVAESANVSLDMSAAAGGSRAGIGEHLSSAPGNKVDVSLRVRGAPGTVATFYTEDGAVKTAPIPDGDETVTYTTRPRDTRYVRAEVRRPDGSMVALTNPIWLGRG